MSTNGITNGSTPKITLYTNHRCPWAHRAHIVIKELGLPYEEVIIDLDKPREPWYLEVNPRGLVPSIKYNDTILTESAIVSHFLCDAHPSHLVPSPGSPTAALARARINFFVDTWVSKAGSYWFQVMRKEEGGERDALVQEFLGIVKKEIEPLLEGAEPYFGGSEKITLAEALVAPFIVRIYAFARNGMLPASMAEGLEALPNFSKWAAKAIEHESVRYIWDEEGVVEGARRRIASLKAQQK
ncbi:thioredoxin-like protein [Polyplosphaeria fusca]|uniref:Thioredoxin-like protein n=1 Tax=Polyplosphaeria fusca TaxID=682080 RepID=A0A9P4V8M2_9PLEO|nr:thioredoxin-like protein [Polyplosphaeria fusca]